MSERTSEELRDGATWRWLTARTEPGEMHDGSPCWLWRDALTGEGYANAWTGQRARTVHRWLWRLLWGAEATGDLHHRCRMRRCVNPLHLVVVSHAEHTAIHNRERALQRRAAGVGRASAELAADSDLGGSPADVGATT